MLIIFILQALDGGRGAGSIVSGWQIEIINKASMLMQSPSTSIFEIAQLTLVAILLLLFLIVTIFGHNLCTPMQMALQTH